MTARLDRSAAPARPASPRTGATSRPFAIAALLGALLPGCGDPSPKAPPAVPAPAAPAVPTATPNIVFIDVAGVRYDTVHGAADRPAALPTFQALAQEGSDFQAAISPAAWETPSLACVLTGLLPDWTGVKGRAGRDRPSLIPVIDTLAETLAGYGYDRAAFSTKAPDPAGGVPRTARLDQGFSTWKESPHGTGTGAAVLEALAERASRAASAPAAPLFLFVHLDATLPPLDEKAPADAARTAYGRAVAAVAPALELTVGAVAKHLPGDTLVFLFSDHGEALGDRPGSPASGRDGGVADEQIRVPLVVRGRGFRKGAVSGCCSLVDLAPSVLEALGLPPAPGLSGTALQPLAAHPADLGQPQFALAWRTGTGVGGRADQTLYAVRSTKAKFVATFSDRPPAWTEELFDLASDAGETRPGAPSDLLAFGKPFADRVEALRGFLGGRKTHLTDPIVVPYVAGGGGPGPK